RLLRRLQCRQPDLPLHFLGWCELGKTGGSFDLGAWTVGPSTVSYDNVAGHYIMTFDLPTWISNDCDVPSWKYPLISLSVDGVNGFGAVSVENYFFGQSGLSAEAAPMVDRKGVIQSTTPLIVYMNTQ